MLKNDSLKNGTSRIRVRLHESAPRASLIPLLSLILRAKCMFGTVANGPFPDSKYNCSLLKSKVSILGFR